MQYHLRIPDFLIWLLFGLFLAGCNLGAPGTPEGQNDALASAIAAPPTDSLPGATATQPPTATPEPTATLTPTATPTPSPSPTPTATPLANNVSGKVCYPGEAIPPMTLYFEETEKETLVELPITENQAQYEVKLPPGTYIAYAWLSDFSRGGLYSRAVPCGLKTGCDDHSLLPFTASESAIQPGIDVCDWYTGPFKVPYPPGKERTEVTGGVSGSLSYPGEPIPELRVVAFSTSTGYWYWIYTQPGQAFYTLTELPPGTYNVVAYDQKSKAGGYVTGNNQLIDVTVESGEITEGVNIADWNAPAGTYPPNPTR